MSEAVYKGRSARAIHSEITEEITHFRSTHPVKLARIDGVQWEYIVSGQGQESLLILPGLMGIAEMSFQLILGFEDEYRVIIPSYPSEVTTMDGMIEGITSAGNLKNLSDEDVQAIIAYLRSQPAVQNQTPTLRPSLLSLVLVGSNLFDYRAQPVSGPVSAPPMSASREYGEYLVQISDCRDCHGPDLTGGSPPSPPGPNLRVVGFWTEEQFFTAMRTGKRPGGSPIKPPMPWKQIGVLDDIQLEAMYEYMHSLPPNEN